MSSTTNKIPGSTTATALPAPLSWPPAQAKRYLRNKWVIAALACVLASVFVGGLLGMRSLFSTPVVKDVQLFTVVPRSFPVILEEKGELKAANSIEVRCEIEGKTTIINLMPEGTPAKKGDVLVELASELIDTNIRDTEIREATARAAYEASRKEFDILQDENGSKIRKADLTLQMAQIALEKYKAGDAVQLRQDANLGLEKAKSILQRAEDDFKDSKDLYDQGFVTRIELENDRFKAYEAKLELKKAELALHVLEQYTIPMNMQEKQSAVTEAVNELERARKSATASEAKGTTDVAGKKSELDLVLEKLVKYRDQKAKSKIVAPADGLVVYTRGDSWWRSDTQIQKGAQVYERQPLIELPDTSSMKVVIRVHEAQTEHLKLGLPATIEIEGFSGRQFSGKVSKIAVLADSQNRWLNPNLKEYETEIQLDGQFKDLKPNITARARIQLAHLYNVLAVPVQAVFGKGGKYFVFLQDDDNTKISEVQLGLSSSEYVEIKKGLQAGTVVRLAVTEEMKLLLPDAEDSDMDNPRKPPASIPSVG